MLLGTLAPGALVALNVGDLEWFCSLTGVSFALGVDAAFSAGSAGITTGELVDDVLLGAGRGGIDDAGLELAGAGSGLMPIPDLSLAAAAAAAEAYLRVSPGGLLGNGAGFIVESLGIDGGGGMLFRVASAGRGDLSWVDGRRAVVGSGLAFFGGAAGTGGSGSSWSCIDCASCDEI